MFNQYIRFSEKALEDFILKLLLCTAAVCFISPFTWVISPTADIKFGSLMVCLAPVIFGLRIGALSVLVYLLLGLAGLPVFAGHQGGIHYLIPDLEHGYSLSTGYLFGYLVAAIVLGFLAEKVESKKTLMALSLFILGHVIIIGSGFYHWTQIPNYEWEALPVLKSFVPSFLVKLGIFILTIQVIERRLERKKPAV